MDDENIEKEAEKKENLDKTTEKQILSAAKRIFHVKGLDGARMQEIADEAGINKAMLHYYFRSKENLFEAIFNEDCVGFFAKLQELISVDLPLLAKIEYFVENYIDLLLKNSYIPAFILNEIHHNPERIKNVFIEKGIHPGNRFIEDIRSAISLGIINPIDPRQLIINIIALCIFPVVARPIVSTVLNFDDDSYTKFIESRKKEVSKFIINSIKIN
ncbi:MAG: TetR/AcrR family transcriptional regulator [Ignavibacteria bacterium]|nr:TetR/AcrR family transcriptional regulator [Ignavibacteria bacterium]